MRKVAVLPRAAGLVGLLLSALACGNPGSGTTLSPAGPSQDLRLALVDQARWAMSAHNMQPWEIELDRSDPLLLRVYLARERLLPATDPYSRQLVMSIGGFLQRLQEAAEARGFATRIEAFPQGAPAEEHSGAAFARPVANVVLRPLADGRPTADGLEPASPDAVSAATVKANLETADLPQAREQEYLGLNLWDGVALRFVRDPQALAQLKPLLREAFRLEMQNEPTLQESYRLMRRNRRQSEEQPWGLSYGSNFPARSLLPIELLETLFPMESRKWGLRGADGFDREIDKAGVFLIITTAGNLRLRQLEAGMLFQKLWSRALADGYALVPASQPLQEYPAMAGYYSRVHRGFAPPGRTIQMIAFLGRPRPGYRSGFRIPAENLLRPE